MQRIAEHAPDPSPTIEAARPAPRAHRRLLWIIALLSLAFAVDAAAELVLPILLALLLALLLEPAVAVLARLRIPLPLGAAIVVLAVAVLSVLAWHLSGPAQTWINAGPVTLDRVEAKLRVVFRPVEAIKDATDRVAESPRATSRRRPAPWPWSARFRSRC